MKKLFSVLLFLVAIPIFAQSPITFDRFALDDEKNSTIGIIEKEFAGHYTINEWSGYDIEINDKKRVLLYFEGDTVSYISVIYQDYTYAAFLELVNKAITKYGEPKGTYFDKDEGEYNVYWWATDPVCDVRISISLDKPFAVKDYIFYGK